MNIPSFSNKRIHESDLELYRSRLTGRFCILIVSILQILSRILFLFVPHYSGPPDVFFLLSAVFVGTMILIITFEYILFKKLSSKIAKYASFVDIALLLLFIGDWTSVIVSTFSKIAHIHPPVFQVTAIYGFLGFSWRALLVTLIIQKWQLKILPPVVACVLSSAYATVLVPNLAFINLFRGACQFIEIVLILYCEDKVKWRIIWSNLHREKWVQVNNFILNNIPENIMILSFQGKIEFVSDHCKSFMEKYNSSHHNTQELFSKIRDLQQLDDEPEIKNSTAVQVERLTTQNELLIGETNENPPTGSLEDLITNFRSIIREKNLQERQFLIYNGKLKLSDNCQEKTIEIKVSFVHHIEKEYLILILRDTTQRDLLVTLQETNKYKDQLLASVSHELRAPLNGNINLVEAAINSPEIPQSFKETLLTPALRSSKFLLLLINDILDMSQIKQNKLRLDFQSRNLKGTLNDAVQLIELQAQKKGIELLMELDPHLPNKFSTDHTRLNQIILNLLSNAIKFTNEGFVKLKVMSIAEENWIKITVEDSGVGIGKSNLHKLFSSYFTIEFEGHKSINPTGVGLGLTIASNLADLLAPKEHPGISVSSIPAQGSIFSFILENKEITPARLLHDSSSSSKIAEELPKYIKLPNIQKNDSPGSAMMISPFKTITNQTPVEEKCVCPKILIVDDNPFNIMAFETILNSLNIKSDSAYRGSVAIQKLLERQEKTCGKSCRTYSVIFMDQEMPEMTGSETVIEIRKLQDQDLIPDMKIIGCTAHKAKEEVEKFVESGLDSCIFKPISVDMIRDILNEILLLE